LTLTEGRNRQVRRMVEALGLTVLDLVRVRIGSLRIGDLPIGRWRWLTEREVRLLMPAATGAARPTRHAPPRGQGPGRSGRPRLP
jgi:16S rRNA U516 pseudouridylate synthase RsuA-like enzyme